MLLIGINIIKCSFYVWLFEIYFFCYKKVGNFFLFLMIKEMRVCCVEICDLNKNLCIYKWKCNMLGFDLMKFCMRILF